MRTEWRQYAGFNNPSAAERGNSSCENVDWMRPFKEHRPKKLSLVAHLVQLTDEKRPSLLAQPS